MGSDSTTGPFGPDPAAARRAAEQVVHDYYAAVNTSIRTGDLSGLEKSFLPSCSACANEVASYRDVFRAGHSVAGGLLEVNSAVAGSVGQSNIITVRASVTENAARVIDGKGKVVQSFDAFTASNLDFDVEVTTAGSFIVADLHRLATS